VAINDDDVYAARSREMMGTGQGMSPRERCLREDQMSGATRRTPSWRDYCAGGGHNDDSNFEKIGTTQASSRQATSNSTDNTTSVPARYCQCMQNDADRDLVAMTMVTTLPSTVPWTLVHRLMTCPKSRPRIRRLIHLILPRCKQLVPPVI